MRVVKPLQTGVLERTFQYRGENVLALSLLWAFRLSDREPVLEMEMWSALAEPLKAGSRFDQGLPKDRAEMLCLGTFHSPNGEPVGQEAVSMRVGNLRKRLLVSGPRHWRVGGPSRPEPITALPIRYEEAFGGDGFPDNPVGKGYAADPDAGERPLPCVEYPQAAVTGPDQTPPPASLDARDLAWGARQRFAGTYDDAYIRERMPGLPDDVDWRLFQDAAEDQWFDDFLRGDEDFELVHLHPSEPRLTGHLPAVRGRAFVERRREAGRAEAGTDVIEVPLQLDTVWLLPEAELGVVIHRGTIGVAESDGADIVNLLAAHEGLADPPRSQAHYREEMAKRTDKDERFRYMMDTAPLLPLGCPTGFDQIVEDSGMAVENLAQQNAQRFGERQREQAEAELDAQEAQARAEIEPLREHAPERAAEIERQFEEARANIRGEGSGGDDELQQIVDRMAPGATGGGAVDMTQMDLSAGDDLKAYGDRVAAEQRADAERQLVERIEQLRQQNQPEQETLSSAIREAEQGLARLRGEAVDPLPRPSAMADLEPLRQQAHAIERYSDELRAAGIDEDRLRASLPDDTKLREQLAEAERQITEQYREGAHHLPASSSPHPGEESARRDRLLAATANDDLVGGDFAFVDLSGQTLRGLDLRDAYLEYVDFTGATLIDVDLSGAILAKATLRDCRFERVTLTNANVGATAIAGALFQDCDFTQARLGNARIARTRFDQCRFAERQDLFLDTAFEAVRFTGCELAETNFFDRDLGGCGFAGSNLRAANFVQCDLTAADFSGADLTRTTVVSTPAPRTCFDGASMDNVRFIDEPVLNDASFREASLAGANLQQADLAGADFTRAVLRGTELSEADLSGARLDRARAAGAQFRKAELGSASLVRADLAEGSLMKARLLRACLRGANLYSVSFIDATLGDTDFTGANLNNTILRDWRP